MNVNLDDRLYSAVMDPVMDVSVMADLKLTLLGGFEARRATGAVVELPGQKDRALLASWPSPPATRIRASASPACCGASAATSRRATA